MRVAVASLALFALTIFPGVGQEAGERKSLSVGYPGGWRVRLSAGNMVREASVIHLKGHVEIRTWHQPNEPGEYLLLLADEADFHIDSGAVEPSGHVTLTPQNSTAK